MTTAQEIREQVRATALLPASGPVVVLVSGGRDSVCLLDLAVDLCAAGSVHALHVNYGLRPEADGDERHCRELCARLAVGLEVVATRRPEQGTGNVQAWARELRYGEALRLARSLDATPESQPPGHAAVESQPAGGPPAESQPPGHATPESQPPGHAAVESQPAGGPPAESQPGGAAVTLVASGHTASDQVETILYRLAASPGRRALLGMSPREGRVVRPLLELTRAQTAAYCEARGLGWREDASNADERYARARVRHGLVPALRAVHPAAEANVLRTAALLRAEAELLDGLVARELGEELAAGIAIARLEALPAALQRLIVVALAEEAAGTFVPQAGSRVAEILALARRGGRAELHVGGLVGAVVEDGRLRMVKLPPRH